MKNLLITSLLLTMAVLTSCKKHEGVGGDASIYGKVTAKHYNTTFTQLIDSEYNSPDVYVYIIYGNDISYGTRIKTNYKAEFEFKNLYKGNYTIYTYSIDSSAVVNAIVGSPPDSAVVKQITISGKKDRVDAGKFLTFK